MGAGSITSLCELRLGTMGASNAGGRWLAREQHEIGAAILSQDEGGDPAVITLGPPLYPLLWRLDVPSLEALASVCGVSVGEFVEAHGGNL